MTHIEISYAETQGIRRLVFQLRNDAVESNEPVWVKHCDHYLKILDERLSEAVMKHA